MDYQIPDLIRKKRDNNILSDSEINYLVQQYSKGLMPDYQMSAFLMAAYLNGLNDQLLVVLKFLEFKFYIYIYQIN